MLKKILLALALTIAFSSVLSSNVNNTAMEPKYVYDNDIMAYLFNSTGPIYIRQARPLAQVPIDLGISYRQLVSLDDKLGILTSSFYLTLQWNDFRLAWDNLSPETFQKWNNITEIVLPAAMANIFYFRQSELNFFFIF